MRAFVAILTLAVWPGCIGARDAALDYIPQLLTNLKIEGTPVEKLVACGRTLGPTKCFHALSSWRASNAIDALSKQESMKFNLTEDVERFPWQKYSNVSDEQLYSDLCDRTEKLLNYRVLKLNWIPSYSFELKSQGNGTLNVDVFSSIEETSRSSMKKMRNQFYRIVPMLLVPGLIMSAILPFILPALKMMVVGVGMLNNMALSSAVFTLLRNNAFNDNYNHKIVYVNAGYRKKKKPLYVEETQNRDVYDHFEEIDADPTHVLADDHVLVPGEDFDNVQEIPSNPAWMDEYYGENNKFVNIVGYKNRRHAINKRKRKNRFKN